jgi:hypothetical protein
MLLLTLALDRQMTGGIGIVCYLSLVRILIPFPLNCGRTSTLVSAFLIAVSELIVSNNEELCFSATRCESLEVDR